MAGARAGVRRTRHAPGLQGAFQVRGEGGHEVRRRGDRRNGQVRAPDLMPLRIVRGPNMRAPCDGGVVEVGGKGGHEVRRRADRRAGEVRAPDLMPLRIARAVTSCLPL
jgi:hypothetical protein